MSSSGYARLDDVDVEDEDEDDDAAAAVEAVVAVDAGT